MMFICCHPAIPSDARVALTLKTLGGFGVSEIARAFLCSRQAVAQRIVRAKRGLREQRPAFELPAAVELSARLDSVLDVIYLMFNEGYAAHEGEQLIRADLMAEALRLAALLLRTPATRRPKVHALRAMMCFHTARSAARTGPLGELILLDEQDRSRWDRRLIATGFAHLRAAAEGDELTAHHLEAGVASCHAAADSFERTDWGMILGYYDQLAKLAPSPVVSLNRAVAVAMTRGVDAGLAELVAIQKHDALKGYYLLPATRGELLRRAGRSLEAADAFRSALNHACSEPERRLIAARLAECRPGR
jgi:RNA polymerase sigma-70 factor (ECF subfamily)